MIYKIFFSTVLLVILMSGVAVKAADVTYVPESIQEMDWIRLLKYVPRPTPPAETTPPIDPSRPMIALTFDDGPSRYTLQILDVLVENNSSATFFAVGNRVNMYPQIVERIHNQGSEVAGHSWDHSRLTRLPQDEIRRQILQTHSAIEAITGPMTKFFRAPFGSYNGTVTQVAEELGFSLIQWSVDPRDWETRNADAIFNAVYERVKDGDIVVLHDLLPTTANAMERLIPSLIARGFQLVTVSDLLYFRGLEMMPGGVYYSV